MSDRIYTAAEAKALLEGTTPGAWRHGYECSMETRDLAASVVHHAERADRANAAEARVRQLEELEDMVADMRRVLLALADGCDAADKAMTYDEERHELIDALDGALGTDGEWSATAAALRALCGVSDG